MAKVSVQIVGDASSLHRALGTATSGTSKLGSVFGKVAGIAGGLGLALGAVEVFKFGKDSINAAAQVQKSTESIHANFGHAADSVLTFGENAAKAYGISNAASTAFSAQIGITARNIGLAHGKAAQMDVGLQKLAGSIGMIKGQDPTKIFSTLTLALAGNTRGLKAMGIVVTPLNEKLQAQRMGFIGPKGTIATLTAAQKAQVIYGIATKHLGEFQAQAKKHSGDFANEQIKLKAQLSNVADTIGAALLPAITRLTGWLATNLPVAIAFVSKEWKQHRAQVMQVVNAITNTVQKNLPQIEATIRRVWHAISVVTKAVWPLIRALVVHNLNEIGDILHIVMDVIQGHWGKAWGKVKALVKDELHGAVQIIKAAAGLLGQAAAAVGMAILHGISRGLVGIGHLIARGLSAIKGAISGIARSAIGWAIGIGRAIMQGIISGLEGMVGSLYAKLSSIVGGLSSAAKKVLGIGSPSRVFAEQVGRPIAEGIALGITQHAHKVTGALAGAVMPGHGYGGTSMASGVTAMSGAGSGTITIVMPVYLDGVLIGKSLQKVDKNYRRQNGGRPLLSGH